ncbi:MAG: hypothetical protein IK119_03060, partial [Bacteroidales bacterium]|nr:hypothetical protein [Bacteroidales bacterium]
LFYNENAFFGKTGTDSNLTIRIRNEKNKASVQVRGADGQWISDGAITDVSTYHHNTYSGFFALRPAYLLKGDATLKSFDYKVIE